MEGNCIAHAKNCLIIFEIQLFSDFNAILFAGILWTKDLVRVLISAKKSVDEDIQRNKVSRKKLWWSVVRRFRAQRRMKITEECCKEKWLELERIYRKNMKKAQNNCVITWPFFWEMHEMVSNSNTEVSGQAVKKKVKSDDEPQSHSMSNSYQRLKGCSYSADDDSSSDNASVDNNNLAAAIRELQDNQNKLLREIVDNQQKRIDELHQEQLSIKSLLMQLLKKLS